jgi:hypothetical protein
VAIGIVLGMEDNEEEIVVIIVVEIILLIDNYIRYREKT